MPITRIRRLLAAAGLGVALAAAAPAAAQAEATYNVYACSGPGGELTMGSWVPFEHRQGLNHDDYCLTSGLSYFEYTGPVINSAQGGYEFYEPAGTDIDHLMWDGGVSFVSGSPANTTSSFYAEIDTDSSGRLFSSNAGTLPRQVRSFDVPAAVRKLSFRLVCDPADGSDCFGRNHRVFTHRLTAILIDPSAPVAANARGSVTTPGYKRGDASLTVDASDAGSGLYRSFVRIDGVVAGTNTHVVDPNGGKCTPVGGDDNGFNHAVPCVLAAPDTQVINTAGLTDGRHEVQVVLEDAAGNQAIAYREFMLVNNPGGALPETSCADGIDNDGDGRVDHGQDAGCVAPEDGDETEAPVSTAAPAVVGTTKVGSSLAAAPGSWNDGPGLGGVTSRRWQACRYDGDACVDIPGRTGPALTLDGEQIGRRIRVVETRTTSEGAASAFSPRTGVVTAHDGSLPACADGRDNDGDGLIDRDADGGCSSRGDTSEDATGADEDFDGDGLPNGTDPDDDGDGVADGEDPAPYNPAIDGRVNSAPGGSTTTIILGPGAPGAPGAPGGAGGAGGAGGVTTVVAGPPTNGANASNRAVVSISGSRTRTVGHGRKVAMVGRLTDENGRAISGAVLSIEELAFVPKAGPMKGAAWKALVPATPLVTDRDGRFRYLVPASHSRIVRVGYRARTADRDFTATTDLTLLVFSKATFAVSRRAVRNGQAVRFTGRLLGGKVPATGVNVVLQAKTPRGWVTFATARAKRTGRFAARYRFHATSGTQRYAFRALVKADSGYPWLPSKSRTVTVTVRG